MHENNYPQSQSFNHFPSEIPESATNVKMAYFRGFLQGEKSFKLSMVVDDDEFTKILVQFKISIDKLPKTKRNVSFDDLSSTGITFQSEIQKYWHLTIFTDTNSNLFPDDFYFQESGNKGIAVSLPRKEVIYWFV